MIILFRIVYFERVPVTNQLDILATKYDFYIAKSSDFVYQFLVSTLKIL